MMDKIINSFLQNSGPLVAIFDLDGTLTKRDTYIPFLLNVLKCRPGRIFYVLILPVFLALFYIKLIDNHKLKQIFLYTFLKGAKVENIFEIASKFINELLKNRMNSIGLELLHYHQNKGDRIIIATASFDIYVGILADRLGVKEFICTKGDIYNGRFTGKISGLNCYGDEKVKKIKIYLENISRESVISYSDDISDYPMLRWAGKGFLVTPNRKSVQDQRSIAFRIIDKKINFKVQL